MAARDGAASATCTRRRPPGARRRRIARRHHADGDAIARRQQARLRVEPVVGERRARVGDALVAPRAGDVRARAPGRRRAAPAGCPRRCRAPRRRAPTAAARPLAASASATARRDERVLDDGVHGEAPGARTPARPCACARPRATAPPDAAATWRRRSTSSSIRSTSEPGRVVNSHSPARGSPMGPGTTSGSFVCARTVGGGGVDVALRADVGRPRDGCSCALPYDGLPCDGLPRGAPCAGLPCVGCRASACRASAFRARLSARCRARLAVRRLPRDAAPATALRRPSVRGRRAVSRRSAPSTALSPCHRARERTTIVA